MRPLLTLSLRQMLGGRKIWILSVFLALPLGLAALVRLSGGFDIAEPEARQAQELAASIFLYVLYPQSLCILAALLYGASLLAGEIEDKTLVYLFTRPIPRWKVLLGKFLATSSALAVLTIASMTLAFSILGAPVGVRLWAALAVAIGLACFAFTAVFALLGLFVPRRAIPAGLIYAALFEGILSTVPALVNELTVSYYLRSLAWRIARIPLPDSARADFEREVAPLVVGADVPTALFALAAIIAVALCAAAIVIHRREWPLTEGV